MRKREAEGALACVGAIIGAGFISGREVVSFFSRYGVHSWWLMLLAALVMLWLCALCMRCAGGKGCACWRELLPPGRLGRVGAEACMAALLCVIGGAMVSAAGHLGRLTLPSPWAYPMGAVGTLCLAWCLCRRGVRPLGWLGGALTLLFLLSVALLLRDGPVSRTVPVAPPASTGTLLVAAVRAVAYAAMNLAVAIGVACGAGCACNRSNDRQATAFALLMGLLLFAGNTLYLGRPELMQAPFPMVALLSRLGRLGFWLSVTLLYLAVLTTLMAVLCALQSVAEPRIRSKTLVFAAVAGAPLCVSMVGFADIVDGLYTPAGLVCLALVFLPMARARSSRQLERKSQRL